MIKEYSWKVSGFNKGDVNKIGKELEIIEQNNKLTAEEVVNYAKTHTDSELHLNFEWDDSIAGEKYRRHQANQLIHNIRVRIIENDEEKTRKPIRAFVQTAKFQNYEPIDVVVKDVDKYQMLLEKAYRELNGVKGRYTELTEIQELLKDIPEY